MKSYQQKGDRPAHPFAPTGAEKVTGTAAFAADNPMPGHRYGGKVMRSPHRTRRIRGIDHLEEEAGAGRPGGGQRRRHWDVRRQVVMLGIQTCAGCARKDGARGKAVTAIRSRRSRHHRGDRGERLRLIEAIRKCCRVVEIDDEIGPTRRFCTSSTGSGKTSNTPASSRSSRVNNSRKGSRGRHVIERSHHPFRFIGLIEPHACLIRVSVLAPNTRDHRSGSSSQGKFMVRAYGQFDRHPAKATSEPLRRENRRRFGGKTIVYLEPLATRYSRKKSGRPLKMVMTRQE